MCSTPAPSVARHVDHLLKIVVLQKMFTRFTVGIWSCRARIKTIAGGAWTVSAMAAATVRRYDDS